MGVQLMKIAFTENGCVEITFGIHNPKTKAHGFAYITLDPKTNGACTTCTPTVKDLMSQIESMTYDLLKGAL